MMDEEITITEEIPGASPWKEWFNENRFFVLAIALLSLCSISLMVYNQLKSRASEKIYTLPTPPVEPTPPATPKPNKKTSPLDIAKKLIRQGKVDEAIALLIKISSASNNKHIRFESAALAKKIHAEKIQGERLKKDYLKGYVIFEENPKQACSIWKYILNTYRADISYYKKTQSLYKNRCQIY
jgi:hypothetical protein